MEIVVTQNEMYKMELFEKSESVISKNELIRVKVENLNF